MNLALLVVSYGVSHRLFEFAWKGQLRALYPTPAAYQVGGDGAWLSGLGGGRHRVCVWAGAPPRAEQLSGGCAGCWPAASQAAQTTHSPPATDTVQLWLWHGVLADMAMLCMLPPHPIRHNPAPSLLPGSAG